MELTVLPERRHVPRFGLLLLAGQNGFKFRQSGAASITYKLVQKLSFHPPGHGTRNNRGYAALHLVLGLAVLVHVVLIALSVVDRRHALGWRPSNGSFALSWRSIIPNVCTNLTGFRPLALNRLYLLLSGQDHRVEVGKGDRDVC